MSTCSNCTRHQRGDVLLEALVGVLITCLIGAGLAGVTARVLNSQHVVQSMDSGHNVSPICSASAAVIGRPTSVLWSRYL